jgi:hypothetical protein
VGIFVLPQIEPELVAVRHCALTAAHGDGVVIGKNGRERERETQTVAGGARLG